MFRTHAAAAPRRARVGLRSPGCTPAHVGIVLGTASAAILLLVALSGTGDVGRPRLVAWALTAALLLVVGGSTVAVLARSHRAPTAWSSLMSLAFIGMTVVLVVRLVASVPGPLESPGLLRIAEVATIPVGVILLALSSAPDLRDRRTLELLRQSVPAVTLALIVVAALPFTAPRAIPIAPLPGSPASLALFALTGIAGLILVRRALRTAELSRRRSDVLVAASAAVLVVALWGITQSARGAGLWWAGHWIEVVGLGTICLLSARDLYRTSSSRPLIGDLSAADIVADEVGYLDGRVHHLMLQLARKDDVTEVHTRRVAMLAVQMGEQLGLDSESLRDLAAGGLLHDIGKLSVPDAILKKPGKLTDAEYDVIKRHPVDGLRILAEVGRFSQRVLHLVEAHHERLDGAGYPNGVSSRSLDLEVKILAVADVYDALTSQRPYRPAWPPDRALDLIERDAGHAFDPACVAALRKVVAPKRYLSAAFRRKLGIAA